MGLKVPARVISTPSSLSPEAQAILNAAIARLQADSESEPADIHANAEAALAMIRPRAAGFTGTVTEIDLGNGALLYRVTPDGLTGRRAEVTYFDIHGGGFVSGGGEMCRLLAMLRALDYGVTVFAVDYRLAPAHQYPAALDDCMAAYHLVLQHYAPQDVIAAGASAGGNLVAAMLLRAHDEGLPLPAGLIMPTPATDMTGAGDSRQTNHDLDINLRGGGGDIETLYVGNADRCQPYVSPVYASIPAGWPPTLLSSGTRDLLLSDTVRFHRLLRRAGVRAELHITEAGSHGGFMGAAPEDIAVMQECKRFCDEIWRIN